MRLIRRFQRFGARRPLPASSHQRRFRLSVLLISATTAITGTLTLSVDGVGASRPKVVVNATSYYATDSKVAVKVGDKVTITANGIAACASDHPCSSGPNGVTAGMTDYSPGGCFARYNYQCPDHSAQIGALVAHIGPVSYPPDNTFFLVGTSQAFTATASGELYFLYNDLGCCYQDNSGSYSVQVKVHHHR